MHPAHQFRASLFTLASMAARRQDNVLTPEQMEWLSAEYQNGLDKWGATVYHSRNSTETDDG